MKKTQVGWRPCGVCSGTGELVPPKPAFDFPLPGEETIPLRFREMCFNCNGWGFKEEYEYETAKA